MEIILCVFCGLFSSSGVPKIQEKEIFQKPDLLTKWHDSFSNLQKLLRSFVIRALDQILLGSANHGG